MSPNIMNMEKEPKEHDLCLQEDGDRDGAKPKVRPADSVLERFYRMGFTRRALLIIAILAVFVLIFFITVIALAARPCCPNPHSDRPLCVKPDCYRTTAKILQQINSSVEPCKNFYEFACGGWLNDHSPIPRRFGDVGVMADVMRDFYQKSRETVDTLPHSDNFRSLQWKLKAFYRSCMDLDSIDSAGDTFLRRQIDFLKGWKPKKDWLMQNWDWAKVLRDLNVEYGVSPFFAVSVRPDDINPYQNVIQISPAGLGLPHWSYYFRSPDDKIINAYQRLMRDLAQQLSVTYQDSSDFARDVFHFEKRIAEYLKYESKQNRSGENQKITLGELRQISQRINWVDFLKEFLPKAYISENTPVYLLSRHYIIELSTILSATDKGVLNSYLIWTLIFNYAPYLSKNYRETVDAYQRVFTGASQSRPRWEFCIETANKIFGVALRSYYVTQHVPQTTLEDAANVYKHVRLTFADTLNNMNWMGSAAESASEKVKRMQLKLTYDDYVLSDAALDSYYDLLSILKTDFVDNIQNGALFRRSQFEIAIANVSRLYMDSDADENSSPYYNEFNRNVVRPVLLQEPFIHSHYPKYMVFGSLGSHFGSELIRKLEKTDNGLPRDGFIPVIWNNVSLPMKYQDCLANNYSQYKIDDFQIDGNKSLSSNLADVGGISQAYEAMFEWEEYYGLEPILPALPYSPEQLFFISYAQTMCSSMSPSYLENFLHLSQSPPDKIRVLGALTQLPQFSSAFGCKPVPSHCELW